MDGNASSGREQDFQNVQRTWERVDGYFSAAIHDVATELGGEELVERIALAIASDEAVPNVTALKILEGTYPGSAELVISRSEQIQQETHQRELAALRKPSPRKYGKAILDGFASLNIFGVLPRTKR